MMMLTVETLGKSRILARKGLPGVVASLVAVALLAGCGGGDKEDQTKVDRPHSMVPANLDTLIAETGVALFEEQSALEADLGRVTEQIPEPVADPARVLAPESVSGDGGSVSKAVQETPEARVAKVVKPGSGPFSLQLGSFRREANAVKLRLQILDLGYPAVIEQAEVGGLIYHRVFIRGLADRSEADDLGEKLHSGLGINYLVRRTQ